MIERHALQNAQCFQRRRRLWRRSPAAACISARRCESLRGDLDDLALRRVNSTMVGPCSFPAPCVPWHPAQRTSKHSLGGRRCLRGRRRTDGKKEARSPHGLFLWMTHGGPEAVTYWQAPVKVSLQAERCCQNDALCGGTVFDRDPTVAEGHVVDARHHGRHPRVEKQEA